MLEISQYVVPDYKLRNFDERQPSVEINTIVLHYTVSDYRSSYMTLIAPKGDPKGVSSHYLIDRDGKVLNLVPDDKIAWHAGKSNWYGQDQVNNYSIGICLVNTGSEQAIKDGKLIVGKKDFYPEEQMTALSSLISHLKSQHGSILDKNIVGHSDVTAHDARQLNPGVLFNWKWLAEQGHGLYPKVDVSKLEQKVLYSYGSSDAGVKDLQVKLQQCGYGIDITGKFDDQTRNCVRAFNMHFHNDTTMAGREMEYEKWYNTSDSKIDDLLEQHEHEGYELLSTISGWISEQI